MGAYCSPLHVLAQATSTSLDATPMNVSITGVDAGNKNTTEAFFNLTNLAPETNILSAKLSYVQSGTSTGQLKLINKYDFAVIDTKLLSSEGLVESIFFKDKVNEWVQNPSKNLGLFIQGSELANTAQINLLGLKLDITYELADTTAPTIANFTIIEMSSTSVSVAWQSDELTQATLEYGRTSLYGSTIAQDTFSFSGEVLVRELRAGSTYHFRLTLHDVADNETTSENKVLNLTQTSVQTSNASDQEMVSSDVLAAPRLLNAEYRQIEAGVFVIDLAWEASKSADIDGYILYRSAPDAGEMNEYKRLGRDTTRYSDEQILAGATYSYFVRGYKNKLITESSPTVSVSLPATDTGTIAGIDTHSSIASDKLALITASAGVVLFLCYIIFKRIESIRKQPHKTKLHNVLKDPEYYMNKFESTILQAKSGENLD